MSKDQNSEGTSHGTGRESGPGANPTPKTRHTLADLRAGLLANFGGRLLWECLQWVGEKLLG